MKTQMTRFILGMAFVAQSFSASAEEIQLNKVEACDQRAGLGLILNNDLGESMGLRSLYLSSDQMILNTKDGDQMILRCETVMSQDQRKAVISIKNGDEIATGYNAEYRVEIPGGGTAILEIKPQAAEFSGARLSKDGNELRMACNSSGQLRSVWMNTGGVTFPVPINTLSNLAEGSEIQRRGSVVVLEQGKRVQARRCMTIQEQETYFANKLNLKELDRLISAPYESKVETRRGAYFQINEYTLETNRRQQQAPARMIGVD